MKTLRDWHFSLALLGGYLVVFCFWRVASREWIVASGLLITIAGLAALIRLARENYFVNGWDTAIHGAVILDVCLEAVLISDHDHFGFLWCALGFAAVLGGYRIFMFRKLKSHRNQSS